MSYNTEDLEAQISVLESIANIPQDANPVVRELEKQKQLVARLYKVVNNYLSISEKQRGIIREKQREIDRLSQIVAIQDDTIMKYAEELARKEKSK